MALALLGGVIVGVSDACAWNGTALACPECGDVLGGKAFLGDLLALAGALMAAAYMLIGRRLRSRTSLLTYIFVVYGMAAVVLVILVVASGQPLTGYSPHTYGWLLLLALVPQLLGHSSFNWALRYLSAAYVSITLLGEPIGSTVLAYFLLKETPTALKVIGAILILAGIAVASQRESGPAA
jgi:drug/metabolite transporter (DMT)-like permease